jgi:hypothetical protein
MSLPLAGLEARRQMRPDAARGVRVFVQPPGQNRLAAATEAISSPAAPVFPRADFPPLLGHHGVSQSFTAHGDCGLPLLSR